MLSVSLWLLPLTPPGQKGFTVQPMAASIGSALTAVDLTLQRANGVWP